MFSINNNNMIYSTPILQKSIKIKLNKVRQNIINDDLFLDKLNILACELNNIFYNANIEITNILKNLNINTRTKKITFTDALSYKFLNSYKTSIQSTIVANYCFDNNTEHVTKSNYYRKEKKIPLTYYQNCLSKLKLLFNKYSNKSPIKIISVDGTYNNTNLKKDKTLETTLNMGYYDVTNCVPINIELKGPDKKNKEIEALINYINDSNNDLNNVILVLDRAYCSFDLMNILDQKNIKYVVRIRNNLIHLNDSEKKQTKKTKIIPSNTRFINYSAERIFTIKDKNDKDVKLKQILICNVATNLSNEYTEEDIKEIYNSRWDVEVFFKLLKYKFKFSNLTEHNDKTKECYAKTYIVILINCILVRLLEIVGLNGSNLDKTKNNKYKIKYNKSLMIEGIKKIMSNIIQSNIDGDEIYKYLNNYREKIYCEQDKHNPRTSKRPFTKWYVMSYSSRSTYIKIIEAKRTGDYSNLHSNLKMLAKTITIIGEIEIE